jgi:hypothetical protein
MAAVSAAARVPTAARPPATSRDIRPRRAPAARAPPRRGVIAASSDADDAMKDEASGAAMRAKESKEAGVDGKRPPRGGDPPPSEGGWEWTLNWDPIVLDENGVARTNPSDKELDAASMIIGSCPRTAEDVDRLVDEAGVQAIICLQCTLCHGALKIDWDPIKKRALERGVLIVRVSVRDFDRLDQAKMLPEMVRKLALFQAMGKKTYVHCTAGINRASLTVLGYLTFVKGMSYDDALKAVRECRPQANPYAVSWNIARARLLAERQEDVYLHTVVEQGGNSAEQGGDWIARDLQKAHVGVIQSIFQRAVESDMSLVDALANVADDQENPGEPEK